MILLEYPKTKDPGLACGWAGRIMGRRLLVVITLYGAAGVGVGCSEGYPTPTSSQRLSLTIRYLAHLAQDSGELANALQCQCSNWLWKG